MADFTYTTGVDNTGLEKGLRQNLTLVDRYVAQANAKLGAMRGVSLGLSGVTQLGAFASHMDRFGQSGMNAVRITDQMNRALQKTSSLFTSGLGISTTIIGLGALTTAFNRSISKAQEFQRSQIAIAANIQSAYTIVGKQSGREMTGPAAFAASSAMATRFNKEIIERQAKNILTYEEQLLAYQSSLQAGARKGLTPGQVMDVSEQAAVVAKSLGLRGEQVANASRLLMGGGVNVARSTIGRALGVTNEEIARKSGQEYIDYITGKMKGFQAAAPTFEKSIEGIISTLQAKFDMFWARVGEGFMKKVTPSLEKLGEALEGPEGARFAESMTTLFTSVFAGLESIAKSPAIPLLMKFVGFLAANGDKIIIGVALLKLSQILGGLAAPAKTLIDSILGIGRAAGTTTLAVNNLAGANLKLAESQMIAGAGGGGMNSAQHINYLVRQKAGLLTQTELLGVEGATAAAAMRGGFLFGKPASSALMTSTGIRFRGAGGRFLAGGEAGFNAWRGIEAARTAQMQTFAGSAGANYLAGRIPGVAPIGATPLQRAGAWVANASRTPWITSGVTTLGSAIPVIGSALAGYGIGTAINNKLWERPNQQEAESSARLKELRDLYPAAARKQYLREELARMKAGGGEKAQGGFWARLFGTAGTGGNILTQRTIEGRKAALPGEIAKVEDAVAQATAVEDKLAAAKNEQEASSFGYGPEAIQKRIWAKANVELAEVDKMVDEDKISEAEGSTLKSQIYQRRYNQAASQELGVKQYVASKGITLSEQYEAGKLGVEADVQGRREELGDRYVEVLHKAQAKFEHEFNLPLKKIESKLQVLDLGVKSENVVESIELARQAVHAKLKEMVDVPKAIRDKMGYQADLQAQADQFMAEYEQQGSAYGRTPAERIYGRTASKYLQSEAGIAGNLYRSRGFTFAPQVAGTIGEIEGNRGTMAPEMFRSYARGTLRQLRENMGLDYETAGLQKRLLPMQAAMLPLQTQQTLLGAESAGLGARQAALSERMFDYSLTPRDERRMSRLDRQVRREMARERGPIDIIQAKADIREGYDLQREGLANARKQADISAKLADLGAEQATVQEALTQIEQKRTALKLDKIEEDYAEAMRAVTAYLNKVINGGSGEGGAPTLGAAVTNNVSLSVEGKMSMTEEDIDKLMPTIRTKLCEAARRTGSRG